jgi:hypothetical protein
MPRESALTQLVVRRLLVDLETPLSRHWAGGDAFRTAFFNALSFSFPAGEQLFIDSVRLGAAKLPEAERARFDEEMRGFIGQEATHRRVHALFNEHLVRQGLVNTWERRILRRRERQLEGLDARAWVGVTAATEHFTAVFADYLLAHPQALAGAEPRLALLWTWHAAEESEHRATAFDLYRAIGGNELWRRRLFIVVSSHFATDLLRQTLRNLWDDGTWWRPSTWISGARFLFGRSGLVRECFGPWRRYLAGDFHPDEADDAAARHWLASHADTAVPVRLATP